MDYGTKIDWKGSEFTNGQTVWQLVNHLVEAHKAKASCIEMNWDGKSQEYAGIAKRLGEEVIYRLETFGNQEATDKVWRCICALVRAYDNKARARHEYMFDRTSEYEAIAKDYADEIIERLMELDAAHQAI